MIGHHLDIGVDVVVIEVQGDEHGIEPGCEVPRQLDAEETIASVCGGARPYYGASRAQDHIATQRYLALFPGVCGSPEWLPDDVIGTLETLDAFDVGLYFQSVLTWSDVRNVGATRQGVVIIGPYSQRIARVAEYLEHHGLVGPVRETVRPIRDQEVSVCLGEGAQRVPALPCLGGGDEALQSLRDIPLPRPLFHQLCHVPLELGGSDQVEPLAPVVLSRFGRERRPPTLDYLFHQHHEMPGEATPGRGQDSG